MSKYKKHKGSWKNRKSIYFPIITVIAILLIIVLGPMDYFAHGYLCKEVPYADVASNEITGYIDLRTQDYESQFKPVFRHFAGFEISLANQPRGNTGNLYLEIINSSGITIDTMEVDLSRVTEGVWYKVYSNKELKKNQIYTLRISVDNCGVYPYLQTTTPQYLSRENISGNLLIRYAYAQSTFTGGEKLLICFYIIAGWLFLASFSIKKEYTANLVKVMSVFVFLMTVLSWNYMYNSMDNQNTLFTTFQVDSETLVTGPIYAEHNSVWSEEGYGLGRYSDGKGNLNSYGVSTYITDENWTEGFFNRQAAITLYTGEYVRMVARVGNFVQFSNGSEFLITDVTVGDTYTNIFLDADQILTKSVYGSLDDIVFLSEDGTAYDKGTLSPYRSQYGLQGQIFRFLARYLNHRAAIRHLNLLCCLAASFVFMMIVLLIKLKYNNLLAGCFFVTFWLSPWIVSFARNLYWVEFTWFLPMVFGLLCSWKLNDRRYKIISYVGTFITVAVKCLCGYEYISVVMMGVIAFLLVDFVKAFFEKDKDQLLLAFRTIVIIGTAALLGFCMAVCIHAKIKGDGNIIEGVRLIINNDVLRRTYGADLNNFKYATGRELYALTASSWETLRLYFRFYTEVIVGIRGNLFPLVCIIPLCIFGYEIKYKTLNYEFVAMYVIFFVTTVSWYILAKQHSYVHTHMNYVLWYFGFIQICFYIIVNKIVVVCKSIRDSKETGK